MYDSLLKLDLENPEKGVTVSQWWRAGCQPGEPIFVACPSSAGGSGSKDDGVILSVVLDTANQNTFLLILDATKWQELARVALPVSIPIGFHGIYSSMHADGGGKGDSFQFDEEEEEEEEAVAPAIALQ